VWPPGSADTVCHRPPLTLTFDHLTLKLVCESHLRWETLLPNLGTLGLWVLELFDMYATDGQTDERTDGWTDKSNAYCSFPTGIMIITRRWHVTISCQPDGRPPQSVRPWKSGRVHLADGSNVVVLELPYSAEFGRDSGKFASVVRKYGKFDDGY